MASVGIFVKLVGQQRILGFCTVNVNVITQYKTVNFDMSHPRCVRYKHEHR